MDRSLRRAVLDRLAAVEDIAVRAGSQLSVRVARSHLKTITGGWRELLLEHQPDLKGRCPVCSGWLRRRRWPCQVWVTAHHHLIGGETPEPPGWSPKKANPFRRPRQVEVVPRQTHLPSAAEQTGLDRTPAEHTPVADNPAAATAATRAPGTEATAIPVAHPGAAHPGAAHSGAAHPGPGGPWGGHPGVAVHATGRRNDDADVDKQCTGELPVIGLPQMPADTGEIHRAAITERTPTLPRSRRGWRSRT